MKRSFAGPIPRGRSKPGKISFYFYIFESMKKARNPLWNRAFCRFPTDYAFLSFIATMISPKSVFSSFVG